MLQQTVARCIYGIHIQVINQFISAYMLTSSSFFNTSAGLRLSYSLDALLGVAGTSLSLSNKGGESGDAITVLLSVVHYLEEKY